MSVRSEGIATLTMKKSRVAMKTPASTTGRTSRCGTPGLPGGTAGGGSAGAPRSVSVVIGRTPDRSRGRSRRRSRPHGRGTERFAQRAEDSLRGSITRQVRDVVSQRALGHGHPHRPGRAKEGGAPEGTGPSRPVRPPGTARRERGSVRPGHTRSPHFLAAPARSPEYPSAYGSCAAADAAETRPRPYKHQAARDHRIELMSAVFLGPGGGSAISVLCVWRGFLPHTPFPSCCPVTSVCPRHRPDHGERAR